MAKFDYDFNLTPRGGKRHGDQWSRRMRLTVLFCIVAAVTAAVIYAIIPRKNVPPVKPPVPPVGAEQPSSAPEAPASAENPSAVQQTAEAAPQETEMPQATPGVPAEQPATEEKPTETTATMPEKGQFSPSDPPSADDMPQRSGEKNPEMENRLNTLFHNGDYASFFAEADRMLAATAPDSEARAGIGGILTSGVKHLWQNGNWQYFATNYKVVPGGKLRLISMVKIS